MSSRTPYTLVLIASGALGCGSIVARTGDPADAAVDVPPTPSGPCRWRVVGAPVIVSDPPTARRFALLDAVATGDGAIVAWREQGSGGRADAIRVRRVREDGTPHPWSAGDGGNRAEIATLPPDAPLAFSMVWDRPRDRVATLSGAATDRGDCSLAVFSQSAQQWTRVERMAPGMPTFALAGCGSLARTSSGWSLLVEEVRALWGTELALLDEQGRTTANARLPMSTRPPDEATTRSAVSDGFVATWIETSNFEHAFHVRRFDAAGVPRGADQVVRRSPSPLASLQVLETGAGLLAVWRETATTLRSTNAPRMQPLDRDGTPAGSLVVLEAAGQVSGTTHAAIREREVLVVASVAGGFGTTTQFIVTTTSGALAAGPIGVYSSEEGETQGAVRAVPTPRGALVIGQSGSAGVGGRVFAVPVACDQVGG